MKGWMVIYRADEDAEKPEDEVCRTIYRNITKAQKQCVVILRDLFKNLESEDIEFAENTERGAKLRKWFGRPTVADGHFDIYEVEIV